MNFPLVQIVSKPAFYFVGTKIHTSNQQESTEAARIPKEWAAFLQNDTFSRISNRQTEDVIAMYTNYESDETGTYTFGIGAFVTSAADIPETFQVLAIEPSEYAVFTSRRGAIEEVVAETWSYIWEWAKTHQRAFHADFEVYTHTEGNPLDTQVQIYISI